MIPGIDKYVITCTANCGMKLIIYSTLQRLRRKSGEVTSNFIMGIITYPCWFESMSVGGNSGDCLNIMMSSYQYMDPHVKDKTVLSLTWESPYLEKTVFIWRRVPGGKRPSTRVLQTSTKI